MSSSTKQYIIAFLAFIFLLTLVLVLYIDTGRKKSEHEEVKKVEQAASKDDVKQSVAPAGESLTSESTTPATSGQSDGTTFLTSNGCIGCHSLDGATSVGPTFKGLFGRKTTVVVDGTEQEITVDEAYIKESILNPNAKVVKGFNPMMPSSEGVLSDSEINAIIAVLKES